LNEKRVDIDRRYKDWYGNVVHVIGWDGEKDRVIFMREGYPCECMQPVEQFREKFTRLE
jgi:hypothetical protein